MGRNRPQGQRRSRLVVTIEAVHDDAVGYGSSRSGKVVVWLSQTGVGRITRLTRPSDRVFRRIGSRELSEDVNQAVLGRGTVSGAIVAAQRNPAKGHITCRAGSGAGRGIACPVAVVALEAELLGDDVVDGIGIMAAGGTRTGGIGSGEALEGPACSRHVGNRRLIRAVRVAEIDVAVLMIGRTFAGRVGPLQVTDDTVGVGHRTASGLLVTPGQAKLTPCAGDLGKLFARSSFAAGDRLAVTGHAARPLDAAIQVQEEIQYGPCRRNVVVTAVAGGSRGLTPVGRRRDAVKGRIAVADAAVVA